MNKLFILLVFFSPLCFSQNLEENIYVATETFLNTPNETSFKVLDQQESDFKNQVNTKDEQLALVFLQSHKGYYLHQKSQLKEAIETYEDALKRFNNHELSKLSDFDSIENLLKPLGNLYTKTGDYTNALNTINQYIFLAEKSNNTQHQISGAINLAILHYTLGNHEKVLKTIDDAFKNQNISNTQKERLQKIKTNSLIALHKDKPVSFLNEFSTSSKFHRHKNEYLIHLEKGNYNKAFNAFSKAKHHIKEANLPTRYLAKFYVEEAQLHHVLNLSNKAIKNLYQAIVILLPGFSSQTLPQPNDLYAENTFIDIFDLYAEIDTNPETILKSLDLSFHVSDLLKDSWTSQETKILNEAENHVRSEKCIDILYSLYKNTNDESFLIKALHYSENTRASTLKEIHFKKNRLQKFPNDSLLLRELQLLKHQERITNELIKEELATNKTSKIDSLSKQLSGISLQLKSLKTELSKKFPDTKNLFPSETIQRKLLKEDAVLANYFYGKNSIYQFFITSKTININKIDLSETVENQIIEFIHFFDAPSIINNNINKFTSKAFNLYKTLKFDVIANHKNAVIIPDGLLNFIPFETLLTSKTNTTSFSKMPFLVHTNNIVYSSSLFFYTSEYKPTEKNTLLGFFPVFENTAKKLTYSINEAEAIETEINSKLLFNGHATKRELIENASNYSILHLSTHASSGNFTTPANIDFYDDTLFLNELYSLDLNPNLVVLSACETGIGKLYKGEGAMSLARGFQFAGAKNLLFSLWQINDLSTSQIMQSFYRDYGKTKSVSYANHQSKLEYLKNNAVSNSKKSPYYWGAFVYYGELTAPNTSNSVYYTLIGIIFFSIIVFLLFKSKRSHGKDTTGISS